MSETPFKLGIIIASTRPGRVGLPVGQWVAEAARQHGGFEVDLIDLAEVNLPLMDEPAHPRLRQYTHQHTLDWSARIDPLDAFIFVIPEYNHSFTAPLKNAVDFLSQEWQHKVAGIVSYGGISGGLRAAQAFKPVLTALRVMVVPEAIAIPFVGTLLDDEGILQPTDPVAHQATALFNEVARWIPATRSLRTPAHV